MLTARRFTSRTTASTLERLETAASNVRPIGLRESHRGAVRAVQSALADLNEAYLLEAQVDGSFGPRTAGAVEAFQRDYGLYADGFVARQTLTQLDVIYSKDFIRVPKGMSLHIGLNVVDAKHYSDGVAVLASCVNDAEAMLRMAERIGYSGSVLTDTDASVSTVTAAIRTAADSLFAGDAFMLSYSGHGAQIQNTSADDEPDGMDETLCLYDRMLVDDELHMLLSEFRSGVRIFIVLDSCHSATAAKAKQLLGPSRKALKDTHLMGLEGIMKQTIVDEATVPITKQPIDSDVPPAVLSAEPLTADQFKAAVAVDDELNVDDLRPTEVDDVTPQTKEVLDLFADLDADAATAPSKLLNSWEVPYKGDKRAIYDTVRNLIGPKEAAAMEARVVSLAACLDSQTTLAGNVLSEFTAKLVTVWGDGKFDGDWQQLIARLKQLGSQNGAVPSLLTLGMSGPALSYERPFAI